jgi:hypothetical protein
VIGPAEPVGEFARLPRSHTARHGRGSTRVPRAAFAVPSRMHGRRCTRQRVLSDLPPSTRCAQAAVPNSHVPGAKASVRSLARDEVSGGPSVRRCRCCRTQVHRTVLAGFGGQSFGIPGRTGNESISRNPRRVPVLNSCAANGAFKAADLARLCNVFAAVINRTAFTGSVTGFGHTPICAMDGQFSS